MGTFRQLGQPTGWRWRSPARWLLVVGLLHGGLGHAQTPAPSPTPSGPATVDEALRLFSTHGGSVAGEGIGGPDATELLRPIDTRSPRSLLGDLQRELEDNYAAAKRAMQRYLDSARLYPDDAQKAALAALTEESMALTRILDLSQLPDSARSDEFAFRQVLMLKEILDRLPPLPPEQIPTAEELAAEGRTSWSVPGTELRFQLQTEGSQAGEFLLSAEAVRNLPDYYRRVRNLPYQPNATPHIYETYKYGFSGLYELVPLRWLFALPDWTRTRLLDQPLWRWAGFGLLTALLLFAFVLVVRTTRRAQHVYGRGSVRASWWRLAPPLAVLAAMPLIRTAVSHYLRFTEPAYSPLMIGTGAIFYLSLTWLMWAAGNVVAETMIASRELRRLSIDSQLIRLAVRFAALVASFVILVEGAQRLGLPAYSIVAGLGVGGVAFALAGREALSNLLGSFIIMLEKPFRIGQWVRLDDTEGIVEEVGFRSTRIRTFYDSIITLPSGKVLESVIDNLGRRRYRRVRTTLHLAYDTPQEKLRAFLNEVETLIHQHPQFREREEHVVFHDFGESSLEILVYFFVEVENWTEELQSRQEIFHGIRAIAERLGVRFAFPTRTVHLAEGPPAAAPAASA